MPKHLIILALSTISLWTSGFIIGMKYATP